MCLVKCSGIYLLDCCKDSDFFVSSQNSYSLYVDGVQKDSERSVNLHGCLCCMNIPIPPDSRLGPFFNVVHHLPLLKPFPLQSDWYIYDIFYEIALAPEASNKNRSTTKLFDNYNCDLLRYSLLQRSSPIVPSFTPMKSLVDQCMTLHVLAQLLNKPVHSRSNKLQLNITNSSEIGIQ